MNYNKLLSKHIYLEGVSTEEIELSFAEPPDPSKGDIALPCFKFAKALRKSPVAIATELSQKITLPDFVEKCAAEGGYLNFYLNRAAAANAVLNEIAEAGAGFGKSKIGAGKTVCIDYSSINIAKPFHIGHLSTTAIGGSLCNIFRELGYRVVGINHLGDWGTQFGKLITAFKKWGDKDDIDKRSVRALLDLYVKFHEQADSDPELIEEGRAWFKKIEDGDPEALQIFAQFKEVTLREAQKTYDKLGVSFDSYNGESFYNDKMDEVVNTLRDKGLLTQSEGALVVDLERFDMPPCLIVKSDGATLYATRDLAAALYRKRNYNFDKCLYVVAYQQNLHFKQVFKVLELMGCDWAKDMVHVPFGMVSLESGTLSTRRGNVVFLEEVLDKAIETTQARMKEKGTAANETDALQTAYAIGVGAVVFSVLQGARIKDIVFSIERVLNFEGETGPYLQYTHARCASLLAKSGGDNNAGAIASDYSVLADEDAFAVIKLINRYPERVRAAAADYEPCYIARLLLDIAQAFNKYYFSNRILEGAPAAQAAKLSLVKSVKTVLANGLQLLLIRPLDKM